MRLAFLLFEYFPEGQLQREFRRCVAELRQRGHHCRVYCISWRGEALAGVDLRRVPETALTLFRRQQRFHTWVSADLASDQVDGVIGFDTMPGLDIYFAADACYLEKTLRERGSLYRRSARHRHFAAWEQAVFAPASATHILLLCAAQADEIERHYRTPPQRLHLLPPGVAAEQRAPDDAPVRRKGVRERLGLAQQDLALLFVGAEFITQGLDRAITALAHLRTEQPSVKSRLLVVGRDKPRRMQRLARRLGVADGVEFLGDRDDITELMLGADVLLHPARHEVVGSVLLEALAAGLPAVVTDNCGYAFHVKAARAGILLATPFSQEQMDRAVMRCIDGVFRAECRNSALLYARLTDLYSMHRRGADLIESLLRAKGEVIAGG
jgi:UDP-glucose:(heptosyl)LPS alpha-1,3-glucosyltransferase